MVDVSLKNYHNKLDRFENLYMMTSNINFIKKALLKGYVFCLDYSLDYVYTHCVEFSKLWDVYYEVVKRVSSLIKEIEFDNPISIFAGYSYLIKNGYLSYGHSFVYRKNIDDCLYLLGANVVGGYGVCRHIASFLTDIYDCLGYDSCNVSMMYQDTKTIACQDFIYSKNSNHVSYSNGKDALYNHLVSLVNSLDGTLILDSTNDVIFFVRDNDVISPVLDRDMVLDCDYRMVFNYEVKGSLSDYLINTNIDILSGLVDSYNNAWNGVSNFKDYFDEFYNNNLDLYKEVFERRKVLAKEFERYIYR